MLKKLLTITFVAVTCSVSSHAINLAEFIAKCDTICNATPIKLTGDKMPQLKDKKIDEIVVFNVENISIDTKQKALDATNTITRTEEMLVVKHNEDDTAVQVFMLPRGENMEMLVTVFDDEDGVIVYLIGSKEIIQQHNIVNIGGKDIIKEALKEKEQKQELTE